MGFYVRFSEMAGNNFRPNHGFSIASPKTPLNLSQPTWNGKRIEHGELGIAVDPIGWPKQALRAEIAAHAASDFTITHSSPPPACRRDANAISA